MKTTAETVPIALAKIAARPASPTGHSLLPLMRGDFHSHRNRIVVASPGQERAIRTPAWHLRKTEPPELYAKPDDFWETNNVAIRCQEVVESLLDAADRFEQAIYGGHDIGGYRFLARSPGFSDSWLADAERLCTGFGERPAGVACPLAVFALPLNSTHTAIVQVADQGRDDSGRPGALAFRLLVLPRRSYIELGADPFHIADQYQPPWEARGDLPALEWTAGPPPHRPSRTRDRISAG